MQLASIPTSVVSANRAVLGSLKEAAATTSAVQAAVERAGAPDEQAATELTRALASARDAAAGVEELGRQNLLDGTFHRYARHSVRHLQDAVDTLGSQQLSADGLELFTKRLFDAEVATRLGSNAGERSLAEPRLRALERSSSDSGSAGVGSSGPAWVDGEWIDELGNPARGGDSWAGPDGERYGSDGSPASDGGYVGPDGSSFSGI